MLLADSLVLTDERCAVRKEAPLVFFTMNLNSVVPDRGEPTIIGIGGSREATDLCVRLDLGALRQKRDMSRVNDISCDE